MSQVITTSKTSNCGNINIKSNYLAPVSSYLKLFLYSLSGIQRNKMWHYGTMFEYLDIEY